MLKMLIVEDERLEREGLVDFIDWNDYGIEIYGTACDGIEGVEKAKDICPDIVFTDIRMPGLDGLEMIKEIKEFLPESKFIILTGYDDFNYAKEAIGLNVDEYLLKPLEEEQLIRVIKNVIKKIDENKNLMKRVEKSIKVIQRTSIMNIFNGFFDKRNLEEEMTAFVNHSHGDFYRVAVFSPQNKDKVIIKENEESINDKELKGEISELFNGTRDVLISNKWIGIVEEKEGNILICVKSDEKGREIDRLATEVLNNYNKEIGNIFIGIGDRAGSLENISMSYKNALFAMMYEKFWEAPGIHYYERIDLMQKEFNENIGEYLLSINKFTKQIVKSIRGIDDNSIDSILIKLFSFIKQNLGGSKELICNFLYNIMNEIEMTVYEMNNGNITESAGREVCSGGEIFALQNIHELEIYMFAFFNNLNEFIYNKKTDKDEYITKKVMEIIHKKYMENINLSTIAEAVFLSPNYLATTFKNHTGKSVKECLNEYRMEKAKILLSKPANKVSWVAKQVGILNTSYFCTVFKNTFGISPGEFQERVIRDNALKDV